MVLHSERSVPVAALLRRERADGAGGVDETARVLPRAPQRRPIRAPSRAARPAGALGARCPGPARAHLHLGERPRAHRERQERGAGLHVRDALTGSGTAQRHPRRRGRDGLQVRRASGLGTGVPRAQCGAGTARPRLGGQRGELPVRGQGRGRQLALRTGRGVDDEQVVPGGLDSDQRAGGGPHQWDGQARGAVGQPQPRAPGRRRGRVDDDVPGEPRRGDDQVEGPVRFGQQQEVLRGAGPHAVRPHLARAPRLVQARVDEPARVRRPGEAVARAHHGPVHDLARLGVLDDPRVPLVPAGVARRGDEAPVGAGDQVGQAEELVPGGLPVLVDEQLLAGQGAPRLRQRRGLRVRRGVGGHPVVRRVVAALVGAAEVPVVPAAHGHGGVGERGVGADLAHDRLGQGPRRGGDGVRPGVLGLQERDHLRVVGVAQPVPRVVEVLAVDVPDAEAVTFGGDGRSHAPIIGAQRWALPVRAQGRASGTRVRAAVGAPRAGAGQPVCASSLVGGRILTRTRGAGPTPRPGAPLPWRRAGG